MNCANLQGQRSSPVGFRIGHTTLVAEISGELAAQAFEGEEQVVSDWVGMQWREGLATNFTSVVNPRRTLCRTSGHSWKSVASLRSRGPKSTKNPEILKIAIFQRSWHESAHNSWTGSRIEKRKTAQHFPRIGLNVRAKIFFCFPTLFRPIFHSLRYPVLNAQHAVRSQFPTLPLFSIYSCLQ